MRKYRYGIKRDLFNFILFGPVGRDKSLFKNILIIIKSLRYKDYRMNLYEYRDFLIGYIKGYLSYKFSKNED